MGRDAEDYRRTDLDELEVHSIERFSAPPVSRQARLSAPLADMLFETEAVIRPGYEHVARAHSVAAAATTEELESIRVEATANIA